MPEKDIGKGNNRADRIRVTSDRSQIRFLLDTPDDYETHAGEILVVNGPEKDMVFTKVEDLGIHAKDVIFDPQPLIGLYADNVQDAIEEAAQLGSGGGDGLIGNLKVWSESVTLEQDRTFVIYEGLSLGPDVTFEVAENSEVIVLIQ